MKIWCCLCSRRTDKSCDRKSIGAASVWSLIELHVTKNGLDLTRLSNEDYICNKCYALISHQRMTDRGTNKQVKIPKPVVVETIINKTVLRGYKPPEVAVSDSSASVKGAVNEEDTTLLTSSVRNSLRITKPNDFQGVINEEDPIMLSTVSNDLSVSHHHRTDRVTNKQLKTVLRGYKPREVAVSDSSASVKGAVNEEDTTLLTSSVWNSLRITKPNDFQEVINEEDSLLLSTVSDEGIRYSANSYHTQGSKVLPSPSSGIVAVNEESADQNVVGEAVVSDSKLSLETEAIEPEESSAAVVNIPLTIATNSDQTVTERSPESMGESESGDSVLTFLEILGTTTTQSKCFICESPAGRNALSWLAIQQVWYEKKIYIAKSNRTCKSHLNGVKKFNEESLQKIEATKKGIKVKRSDFELWLDKVSTLPNSSPYNFNEGGIDAGLYKTFLGITKEDFDDLVTYLHDMRNTATRSLRNALAMFLMLLRNNMKQEVIAFNFSTSQQVVSNTIDAVSSALEEHFVPKHLGYHHITRDQALQDHSIKLTSDVLGRSESRLYLIADCTYNYIEKPTDFELQRKTFSPHKKRNLLKPLFIVLPDGYILEAVGPFFCDPKNNDAANIRYHYNHSDILLFLEEDDCFIFDRGFRDVVKETEANGQSVVMPSLLQGKRIQFTCDEANESRKL